MSRVHVSSRSGGWRVDGSECPQPEGGRRRGARGRRIEKKGGGEERRKDRGGRGAGWLSLHVRGRLLSPGRTLCSKQRGADGCCVEGSKDISYSMTNPKQKLVCGSMWNVW